MFKWENFTLKIAFLLPFYNHSHKFEKLIIELLKFNIPIFVINDGSDEKNFKIVDEISKKYKLNLINFDKNRGKGAVCKDGFKIIFEAGFTHAFQIDSDFQHDINEINSFINHAQKNQDCIICGDRIYDDFAPNLRKNGRKITDFWMKINSLGKIKKDTMCGFRIYPLKQTLEIVKFTPSQRMEFDMEIILNAVNCGFCVKWLKVKVKYESDGVSHFKMFRDNILISKMHTRHFLKLPNLIIKKFLSR